MTSVGQNSDYALIKEAQYLDLTGKIYVYIHIYTYLIHIYTHYIYIYMDIILVLKCDSIVVTKYQGNTRLLTNSEDMLA